MADIVISARDLGKRYVIGHQSQRESYQSMRDTLARGARNLARKARDTLQGRLIVEGDELEEVWALRGLDFDVERGEVIGMIGRNGAGKSTLLKILSRIVEPSAGEVRIRGRVVSLLEVGTGFHPELSGRENIFLNGAILGMTRQEVRRRFDEIVTFAEVERFLDTPVKRYSSGMYVRLAFAVAAHLDAEILIVDEVLAVGDADFQKKCIGKMQDTSRGGRTVLFVSHNLGSVAVLCNRGIVLDGGRIAFQGPTKDALAFYARSSASTGAGQSASGCKITSVRVDETDAVQGHLKVTVDFEAPRPLSPPLLGIVVSSSAGAPVFGFNTMMDCSFRPTAASRGAITMHVPDAPLHTGMYRLSLWLGEKNENYIAIPDAIAFHFIAPTALPAGISQEVVGSTRVQGRFTMA